MKLNKNSREHMRVAMNTRHDKVISNILYYDIYINMEQEQYVGTQSMESSRPPIGSCPNFIPPPPDGSRLGERESSYVPTLQMGTQAVAWPARVAGASGLLDQAELVAALVSAEAG